MSKLSRTVGYIFAAVQQTGNTQNRRSWLIFFCYFCYSRQYCSTLYPILYSLCFTGPLSDMATPAICSQQWVCLGWWQSTHRGMFARMRYWNWMVVMLSLSWFWCAGWVPGTRMSTWCAAPDLQAECWLSWAVELCTGWLRTASFLLWLYILSFWSAFTYLPVNIIYS